MKQSDETIKRQSTQIRFHVKDMDFMLNWFVGLGLQRSFQHAAREMLIPAQAGSRLTYASTDRVAKKSRVNGLGRVNAHIPIFSTAPRPLTSLTK